MKSNNFFLKIERKKRVWDYPFFSDKKMDVYGLFEFCKSVLKVYTNDEKKKKKKNTAYAFLLFYKRQ